MELAKEAALASLAGDPPQVRLRASMLQLFFEDSRQHYELWLRTQVRLVEMGLHFEGVRDDNLRRIAAVAEAMPLVAGELGPDVEVEEWTESWTRVHETVPLRALDEAFASQLGLRLARYIEVLEPIVRPLGSLLPPVPRKDGGRWRNRGRRRVAG